MMEREANSRFPYETRCRLFTGYRPCEHRRSCLDCPHLDPVRSDVLIINLDGLGDVLRTTSLLPALRRSIPGCRVTWLTRARAVPLLDGHPDLDAIICLNPEGLVEIDSRTFDLVLNVDRSVVGAGLAMRVRAAEKRGFGLDSRGVLVPLNDAASYLYATGLDDDLKFRRNEKTVPEMTTEAMGFPYRRDPYRLVLDTALVQPPRAVGFNTGAHPGFPRKRLSLDIQEEAIRIVVAALGEPVLLLGGPEDASRNRELAHRLGAFVEETPTDEGLRAGAAQVDRCQVVFSGDSLGLHLAIALQKHVVAWFGLTCPQEIEVYGRGIRLLSDVSCAPCWRRRCDREPSCDARVDPRWIARAVLDALEARGAGTALDDVRGGSWWRPQGFRGSARW